MILLIAYSLFLLLATVLWLSARTPGGEYSGERVSAIVVVRNEEENIVQLLESFRVQTHENLEVILVDDQSTDQTVAYAESVALPNLRILRLEEAERGTAPKKAGIEKAMKEATGSLIFTTDGDCVLPAGLIGSYAGLFSDPAVQMISGPVTFTREKTLWNQLQTVEFSSLVGSAAVGIFLNQPIMSSAANLAYRKAAFLEVGGYSDNTGTASGDDEFLMNKIHKRYRNGILFARNKKCIVETRATKTLQEFYRQRKRWAGKWSRGQNPASQITAILIFLVNALTIWFLATGRWEVVLFRFFAEALFLAAVLIFLKRWKTILYIPLTQLIYPFYAVFFGLISLVPTPYTWKGRRLK